MWFFPSVIAAPPFDELAQLNKGMVRTNHIPHRHLPPKDIHGLIEAFVPFYA
jgi:hypothetical protein